VRCRYVNSGGFYIGFDPVLLVLLSNPLCVSFAFGQSGLLKPDMACARCLNTLL